MGSIRDDLLYNKTNLYHNDVTDYFSDYILPRHVHDDNSSCVLEISGSEFTPELDQYFLTVSYKVEKKNPDASAENRWINVEHTKDSAAGPDATLAPINNVLESMFTQYDISVNGKIVTESNHLFPYTAFLLKLLNFSNDAKNTFLTLSGWNSDTLDVDTTTSTNKGWEKRRDRIKNGRIDTVCGVLYSDLAFSSSLLPSNADVALILHKSSPQFFLQGGDASTTYRVKIEKIQLETRKYELSPKLNQAIERQLSSNGSVPFSNLSTANYFIPVGNSEFQVPRLVMGQIPLRVIFGIVTNSAFTGDVTKSPFNFKKHGVKNFTLSIDGRIYPARPLEVTNYIEPYQNLFRNMGQYCNNTTCGISMEQFQSSCCLHVINLRCDQEIRSDIYPYRKRGTVSLKLNFDTATIEGLTLIVLTEFENIYSIDRLRNITSDHAIN
jgi:hypothetical protein